MRIVEVETSAQMAAALRLRTRVFVDEQGVRPEAECDEFDDAPSTLHVLVLSADAPDVDEPGDDVVWGTGRLLAPGRDGRPHVGRVAVAATARGRGVGSAVMEALERAALERYGDGESVVVALSAQVQAIPFYERLGYEVSGEPYLDEGIWHRDAAREVRADDRGTAIRPV